MTRTKKEHNGFVWGKFRMESMGMEKDDECPSL